MKKWLIYKHTCVCTNKSYIGLTCKSMKRRWQLHVAAAKNGQTYFHNAINKYGVGNFTHEVLHENILSVNDADTLEEFYISKYNTTNPTLGYNLTAGGTYGKLISDETRAKLSAHSTGRKHSDETRAKMSASHSGEKNAMYGQKHGDETRAKMSVQRKGEKNAMYGRTHSNEARSKIGEAQRNRVYSEEERLARSERQLGTRTGKENSNFKGYYKTPFSDELFDSTTSCMRYLLEKHNIDITKHTVISRCKNSREKWKDWKFIPKNSE